MSKRCLNYISGNPTINESARASVFGELVKLTRPLLSAYTSDLYHDAHWLAGNVIGNDVTFYFGVRESGTSIGLNADLVAKINLVTFRIRVYVEEGSTHLTVSARR
jgi:hypothetical protein